MSENNTTNPNSNNKPFNVRPEPSPDEIRLNELWHLAVTERIDIFMNIKKKSEIPFYFHLVGNISEPISKKSNKLNADRPNSRWEIWRDNNKTILIFRVDGDDYELLAARDMGITDILKFDSSTEILKATMKLFRMFK